MLNTEVSSRNFYSVIFGCIYKGRFCIHNNRIVKNSIWNSAGIMTYFACQWLISIAVVWLYGDFEEAGYLALAMNISNIFSAVALYNIRNFQVSDIKGEYNDSEYVATRILTCVASLLLCAAFTFIVDFTPLQRIIIICYMVFRANESFIDVFHGIDQKNWKMDYIGKSLITRGVAMLGSFVLLGWFFDLLQAIIGMAVITTLIGLLYDLPRTKKLAEFTTIARKKVFSLLKRCFPVMLVVLFGIVIVSYARYSIERIHGTVALGIYASVTAPAFIVQITANVMFAPLANMLTDCLKEGNKGRYLKIFTISAAIIIGITAAFAVLSIFFGEWVLVILYGEPIRPYAYLLPGVVVVSGLTGFIWFMNLVITATRDIKGMFIGNLTGAVICLATATMFLNQFGIIGANHVMILCQGIVVLFLIIRLFWFIKNKPELFADKGMTTLPLRDTPPQVERRSRNF